MIQKIHWEPSYQKNGQHILPGSLHVAFGRFSFAWMVKENGFGRLAYFEAVGAGEMPALEKPLFPEASVDSTTLIFQEWNYQMNIKLPAELRPVGRVRTVDLLSVYPRPVSPPLSPEAKLSSIKWSSIQMLNKSVYLEGDVMTGAGMRKVVWKKQSGRIPELVVRTGYAAGDLPTDEERIFFWHDDARKVSVLFQLRSPQLATPGPSFLWRIAVVKTDNLMDGFFKVESRH